jgi:hypothetical protein
MCYFIFDLDQSRAAVSYDAGGGGTAVNPSPSISTLLTEVWYEILFKQLLNEIEDDEDDDDSDDDDDDAASFYPELLFDSLFDL